jgi:hypothetical protein
MQVFLPESASQLFFIPHPHFHVIPDALDHEIEDPQGLGVKGVVKIEKDMFNHQDFKACLAAEPTEITEAEMLRIKKALEDKKSFLE